MTETEIKRLARHMAGDFLRGVLDGDALEVGLEMRNLNLSEEEIEALSEAMQEIIDRLRK